MNTTETVLNETPYAPLPVLAFRQKSMASLKPKGACWYCNTALDNIRRFCGKSCAEDYQTEEEVFR